MQNIIDIIRLLHLILSTGFDISKYLYVLALHYKFRGDTLSVALLTAVLQPDVPFLNREKLAKNLWRHTSVSP